ncbi:Bacterial type II/III secretion system short domain protein [Maioricimonas rarisocia]|uniref:Bacterial type II/III secretion system short domain protein n=1 Tax=Maioricimonas rarisocia TaxID=2528026 RepID=A0A517Z6Y7_9PLAN|nr:secretin N-terminal domain-containing protein [Maioricimonas rarisocia]QDU38233.1 Bacterial type II/III secretion system short domain protein [Maioricimonas rarisocia]
MQPTRIGVLLACALMLLPPVPSIVSAQGPAAAPQTSRVVRPSGEPSKPGSPGQKPGDSSKSSDEKKPDGDQKEDEKKEEEGKPKIISRSSEPQLPEKFISIDIKPDADGKVTFNFQGVPWLPVLTWLAKISDQSLDWQELPGDYLNLRTQRAYDLKEARDLINRHLLARGFTLLLDGELLTVVNIKKINPGLVPRAEPDELADRMPHDFAKVSFPLKWMIAEKAAEELKPMLSENGTIAPLKSVNRLEVMDAVINLQEIHRLLTLEQSSTRTEPTQIKVFRLEHVRAEETVGLLEEILGLEKPPSGDISNSMGQQIMQQLQRMQQRSSSGGSNGGGDEEGKPRLIVNSRQNSILAHAPPDKMEIIEETILAVDVPQEGDRHILQNMDRMKVYRLITLDPQPLVQILLDLGDLSPRSRIQVDEDNRSIIVFGTLADHVTVKTLVDRLDGSNRSFEVVPLRRLRADEVAGTIQYMMGEEEEEEDNNRGGYYSYYSSRYGSRNSSSSSKDTRPFRVDADVENNRLLLWANDVEYEEVSNLLEKMGEIPPDRGSSETMRVIDLPSDGEAREILKRLEGIWPTIRPNELQVQPLRRDTERRAPADSVEDVPRTDVETKEDAAPVVDRGGRPAVQLAVMQQEHPLAGIENGEEGQTSVPAVPRSGREPPIVIQQLPDGRILLGSQDTRALDHLEEVLGQLTPDAPDFHVFQLKHPNTWAYGIELILEEYFQNEEDNETVIDPWWGYSYSQKKDSGSSRLSRRKQLKIISDSDSQTILVQGATNEQLKIIQNLIDIYDQPVSSDPASVRRMQVFRLQYSEAKTIADTVKSVYRDLLSANDPALQSPNQSREPSVDKGITYVYNRGPQAEGSEEEPQTPIRFKGLLSVGVDEISNSVVVSAAEGLMVDISELIEALDEAARPQTKVQVLQLSPGLDVATLKERLNDAFGEKRNQDRGRFDRRQFPGQGNNGPQPGPQPNGGQAPRGR